MSAEILRKAATILRERAEAATPGPWSAADEHGLMPDADPAWCISQMRPGYESMSDTEGYIGDVAEVWCDRKDACPDADYIATMHPGVGLAFADWLDSAGADFFAWGNAHHDPDHEPCDYCDDDPRAEHLRRALALARLIVGGSHD